MYILIEYNKIKAKEEYYGILKVREIFYLMAVFYFIHLVRFCVFVCTRTRSRILVRWSTDRYVAIVR